MEISLEHTDFLDQTYFLPYVSSCVCFTALGVTAFPNFPQKRRKIGEKRKISFFGGFFFVE